MAITSSPAQQDLHFSGLDAPVALVNADVLLPMIEHVMPRWPIEICKSSVDAQAFLKISGVGNNVFESVVAGSGGAPKRRDAVDCVCQMVAEAAWEQIRSNPLWLCLHCAAVEFAGRLVLFPNRHRAGKSTLTAILAARGYRIFTDDFLAIEIAEFGAILGRANGVAPRIRLPVPNDFSHEFQDLMKKNPGPENKRYKYLESAHLPEHGARLPIGAVVVLDRETSPLPAGLSDLSPVDTVDVLIRQNFARNLHSGRILRASKGVTETAGLFRLTYFSAEDAADVLERYFETWRIPVRNMSAPECLQKEPADMYVLDRATPFLELSAVYKQAEGVTVVVVDGSVYVSDPAGLSIQKLNPISGAIWRILEHPATIDMVSDILLAAFPAVGLTKIRNDAIGALRKFVKKRLIEPVTQAAMVSR